MDGMGYIHIIHILYHIHDTADDFARSIGPDTDLVVASGIGRGTWAKWASKTQKRRCLGSGFFNQKIGSLKVDAENNHNHQPSTPCYVSCLTFFLITTSCFGFLLQPKIFPIRMPKAVSASRWVVVDRGLSDVLFQTWSLRKPDTSIVWRVVLIGWSKSLHEKWWFHQTSMIWKTRWVFAVTKVDPGTCRSPYIPFQGSRFHHPKKVTKNCQVRLLLSASCGGPDLLDELLAPWPLWGNFWVLGMGFSQVGVAEKKGWKTTWTRFFPVTFLGVLSDLFRGCWWPPFGWSKGHLEEAGILGFSFEHIFPTSLYSTPKHPLENGVWMPLVVPQIFWRGPTIYCTHLFVLKDGHQRLIRNSFWSLLFVDF